MIQNTLPLRPFSELVCHFELGEIASRVTTAVSDFFKAVAGVISETWNSLFGRVTQQEPVQDNMHAYLAPLIQPGMILDEIACLISAVHQVPVEKREDVIEYVVANIPEGMSGFQIAAFMQQAIAQV